MSKRKEVESAKTHDKYHAKFKEKFNVMSEKNLDSLKKARLSGKELSDRDIMELNSKATLINCLKSYSAGKTASGKTKFSPGRKHKDHVSQIVVKLTQDVQNPKISAEDLLAKVKKAVITPPNQGKTQTKFWKPPSDKGTLMSVISGIESGMRDVRHALDEKLSVESPKGKSQGQG